MPELVQLINAIVSLLSALTALLSLLFGFIQWKGKIQAESDKRDAQENEKVTTEKLDEIEKEVAQVEKLAAIPAPALPEIVKSPDMPQELEKQIRLQRDGMPIEQRRYMIYCSERGDIPVYVTRFGLHNHRCILPDGSTPLIPDAKLTPVNSEPPKDEPKPGRFDWLWRHGSRVDLSGR